MWFLLPALLPFSDSPTTSIIQRFQDKEEKVLTTTNVCVQGIAVKQVTIAMNFDLPVNQAEEPDYKNLPPLHRADRMLWEKKALPSPWLKWVSCPCLWRPRTISTVILNSLTLKTWIKLKRLSIEERPSSFVKYPNLHENVPVGFGGNFLCWGFFKVKLLHMAK